MHIVCQTGQKQNTLENQQEPSSSLAITITKIHTRCDKHETTIHGLPEEMVQTYINGAQIQQSPNL
jgi:hypothetical protein